MVRIFKTLIPLLLIFSFDIEASKLLDPLKTMPVDQSQEFNSVDEYMQYRFETLEQNGMPEEAIQLMKDSYELYKIELAIKQIENKDLSQNQQDFLSIISLHESSRYDLRYPYK